MIIYPDDKIAQKTTLHGEFSGCESYEDVLKKKCTELCNQPDVTGMQLGMLSSPVLTSCDGKNLYNNMKMNKIYASKNKIYLVVSSPEDEQPPPMKKKTESSKESGIASNVPLIKETDLKLGPEIGSGGCSRVFKGVWCKTDVAVKKMQLTK